MAHSDDAKRVLVECSECSSAYAARRWPDGTLRVIGRDGCSCGSDAFSVVDDDSGTPAPSGAE